MAVLDESALNQFVSQVEAKIEQFVLQVLLKIEQDAKQIIITGGEGKPAYASGQLHKNMRHEIIKEAGRIIGVVGVGANVPYAIFRHEGTKPHFPPIEPIKKWVAIKGLLGKKGFSPKTISGKKGGESSLNSIAFLIARKISKTGTQGLPFLKMALEANVNFIASKLGAIQI